MKSYSGKGIFNATEAKARRKSFDSRSWRGLCRGIVAVGPGHAQLEATEGGCRQLAIAEGISEYLWFDGSLEEWLDGKPFSKKTVS